MEAVEGRSLSLAERVNTLFRVWRKRGAPEQSNSSVAESLRTMGGSLSEQNLVDIREGAVVSVDEAQLQILAQHFGTEPGYLTSDDGAGIHKQLLLLGEILDDGVKGIFLRGGASRAMSTSLLGVMRAYRSKVS